ncbi:uncharacterized protein [Drosophila pseudoobscura]|uniref:MD-2-related lipid-recognition domain-containing protein n=1 Tax=Drosophila pseudoobscura pseudoobscura TaxID=46245 RepID=A0A6I8V4M1_DROPS|nr:uncharacterized protein LOC6898695 [Drosophila pseudoobscura]
MPIWRVISDTEMFDALVSGRWHFLAAAVVFCSVLGCEGRRSNSRFTNLQCESYSESFATFSKCKLNLLARGRAGVNIHCQLHKTPITNVWMNWSMYRRYNGWRPFMYNVSKNFCQLMANVNDVSFEGLVINAIMTGSNLNHTCPYNHDIILDNLEFTDDLLKTLPLPKGDYKIQLRFASDKTWRLQVSVFFARDEQ